MNEPQSGDSTASAPLTIRGEAYPLITICVQNPQDLNLRELIAAKVKEPRTFWQKAACILDLTALSGVTDLSPLLEALIAAELVPAGFRALDATVTASALAAGLGRVFDPTPRDQDYVAGLEETSRRPPLVINGPVRSGQEVYAAGGDLIVLSSVSAGARVIADGNIHIYGALRGSAYAGRADDPDARIFAHALYADVVSINGLYLSSEDFPQQYAGARTQVRLDNGFLKFSFLPS